MSKTPKIGYIASFPIPEVIRDINSVMLGMQKVNPKAELKIVWVSTWYDPGKEKAAVDALMDQGVDVLIQHTDSPAALQAAQTRGRFAVGQASDMTHFGPKAHLHSVMNNWAIHYIRSVQSIMDGTWKSRDYWGGMKDGVIKVTNFNARVPAKTRKAATALIDGIKSGAVHPFTGPIYDQSGKLRVAAGKTLSNGELASMNWYVKGENCSIPK